MLSITATFCIIEHAVNNVLPDGACRLTQSAIIKSEWKRYRRSAMDSLLHIKTQARIYGSFSISQMITLSYGEPHVFYAFSTLKTTVLPYHYNENNYSEKIVISGANLLVPY